MTETTETQPVGRMSDLSGDVGADQFHGKNGRMLWML
jgi:hypothetical protein